VKVRTFIALELSEGLKEGILTLGRNLETRGVRASWAAPSTMHLTLRFLGDVEEGRLPEVIQGVGRAASNAPEFWFETGGIGAFPSPRRPRVIWVGVEPNDELFDLQGAIERELSTSGFPRERRPYRPHLTVGRIRDRAGPRDLTGVLASLEGPHEAVHVRDVLVMKSTLKPSGAVHETLATLPLEGGGAPSRNGRP
jgi:2'-5' RNA ligase